MKYKIGQKVIIKRNDKYDISVVEILEKFGYILTVKTPWQFDDEEESYYYYDMEEESSYIWPEKFIEGLYEEPILDPIDSRFEILDL